MTKLIYVLSDSIGETANKVLQSALSQFPDHAVTIEQFPFIDEVGQIKPLVVKAKANQAFVLFTFVKAALRDEFTHWAKLEGIRYVDMMGRLLIELTNFLAMNPAERPGQLQTLDQRYYDRVDAIEFAVKYDDGKDPRGILRADIILIGISRTSKTPLSMYLAGLSYKVANVPIYPEAPLPQELYQVDSRRIIGLTNRTEDLVRIRQERMKQMGFGDVTNYSDSERIELEQAYAQTVFQRLNCVVIDVSTSAVEETASKIVKHLQNKEVRNDL